MSSFTSNPSFTSQIFTTGNTAIITGASSGIGRAAALFCASHGMHVYMIDVDEEDLSRAVMAVGDVVKDTSVQKIQSSLTDVSDNKQMKDLSNQVFADKTNKSVHFLMNNAGIQLGGNAQTTPMEEFEQVMKVNTYGPIHGVQVFLPTMKERNQPGLIVNTGSKQGITMPPGNLSYNVSKAALKTFCEGLEHELMKERKKNEHGIRSALLIPGWVNTSILFKETRMRSVLEKTKFDPESVFFHQDKPASGAWMPKQVIEFMSENIDLGKFYIICPDNDVDRETDNIRMTWTMQDITQDRPPLSRWHPEWKDKFTEHLGNTRGQEQGKK